jgi:hypothetical protein
MLARKVVRVLSHFVPKILYHCLPESLHHHTLAKKLYFNHSNCNLRFIFEHCFSFIARAAIVLSTRAVSANACTAIVVAGAILRAAFITVAANVCNVLVRVPISRHTDQDSTHTCRPGICQWYPKDTENADRNLQQ